MLFAAAWLAMFAFPLLFLVRPPPARESGPAVGFVGAYRALWHEVKNEWRRDHNVVYYLLASAVRSEERRVGKERRAGWAPGQEIGRKEERVRGGKAAMSEQAHLQDE